MSRTLLIKGLEFDHTVILDASEHNAKHLKALDVATRQQHILADEIAATK